MDDKDRDEAKKLCERLDWMKINGKNDLIQWENVLSNEIARIRAEACADERRRCAERYIKILKLAREKIQDHVNEIYSSGGVEYLGLGSTLDGIDKVLKELESNG